MADKTVEQRLQELLDEKDALIERLRDENAELKDMVAADPCLWALGKEVPDRGLPVPRLEIEWTPDDRVGWSQATATYRLVYHHRSGKVIGVGLGRTVRNGMDIAPIRGPRETRPGTIDLPGSDGAQIRRDMAELRLPGYAVCGEQIDDLSK